MTDRNSVREIFFSTWKKYLSNVQLGPVESTIKDIILQHPEYHEMLTQPEMYTDQNFENHNPFLHLSLHLALVEQVATDRPSGIQKIYQLLCKKFLNSLEAEHQMLPCLEKVLWDAQKTQSLPDEKLYLGLLSELLKA